nr:unnamed protein product [Digitaria exilis]
MLISDFSLSSASAPDPLGLSAGAPVIGTTRLLPPCSSGTTTTSVSARPCRCHDTERQSVASHRGVLSTASGYPARLAARRCLLTAASSFMTCSGSRSVCRSRVSMADCWWWNSCDLAAPKLITDSGVNAAATRHASSRSSSSSSSGSSRATVRSVIAGAGAAVRSARQSGQVTAPASQGSMQSGWNTWQQAGRTRRSSSSSNAARHTAHSSGPGDLDAMRAFTSP